MSPPPLSPFVTSCVIIGSWLLVGGAILKGVLPFRPGWLNDTSHPRYGKKLLIAGAFFMWLAIAARVFGGAL